MGPARVEEYGAVILAIVAGAYEEYDDVDYDDDDDDDFEVGERGSCFKCGQMVGLYSCRVQLTPSLKAPGDPTLEPEM
jgi:hypothetical protein